MSARIDKQLAAVSAAPSWWLQLSPIIALAAVGSVGLIFDFQGYDSWRMPKLLLLHATGILLIGGTGVSWLLQKPIGISKPSTRADLLLCGIITWTVVTTIVSSHRLISIRSLLTVICAAAVFVVVRSAARRWDSSVLLVLLVPAAINAGVAVVQQMKLWNALVPTDLRATNAATIGLLGNPNDVGSYLVPAFALAAALAAATRDHRVRLGAVALLILISAGVVASHSRGAMLALLASMAGLAVMRWRKPALAVLFILAVAALLSIASNQSARNRASNLTSRDLGRLSSGRIVPYGISLMMVRENPLFGVGPGCFGVVYFDYAVNAGPELRKFSVAGKQWNFGETHNDYLQIAAETGLPGLLLLCASLTLLGAVGLRQPRRDDERDTIARYLAPSLAAGAATLMMFQFPLYLSASLLAYCFCAAICVGWSRA